MSKPKGRHEFEPLSISKCKRMVRPLLSKIHHLTDLSLKSPSLLDISLPYDEIDEYLEELKRGDKLQGNRKGRSTYRSSRSGSRTSSKDSKMIVTLKVGRRNLLTYDRVYPEDTDTAKEPKSHVLFGSEKFDSRLNKNLQKFLKPMNSFDRLSSLKPFVCNDLFHSYSEIFHAFRNIMFSISQADNQQLSSVTKLSSLCSRKLGQNIALSTKTTFYKMNQSILFDPSTVPGLMKDFSHFADDIEDWLQLEPSLITKQYRVDFVLGYIIHLLVFNLYLTLYLLIPTLVHWLYEELLVTLNGIYKSALRTFFEEYFFFSYKNLGDITPEAITQLHGPFDWQGNVNKFWTLHEIGYWKDLIETLDFKSKSSLDSNYEALILDFLSQKGKLELLVSSKAALSRRLFLENDILPMMQRNAKHKHINELLMRVLSISIFGIRQGIKKISSTQDLFNHLQSSLNQLRHFTRTWLVASSKEEDLYCSMYDGNKYIFEGVLQSCDFLCRKYKQVLHKLKVYSLNTQDDSDTYRILRLNDDYKRIYKETHILKTLTEIVMTFYLDNQRLVTIEPLLPRHIANFLIELQFSQRGSKMNFNYDDLKAWLYSKKKSSYTDIARRLSSASQSS